MKINGKTVKTVFFTRYCKDRLGYASKENTSLYELVCLALEVDGMPMPMNMSIKKWVQENIDHIVGTNEFARLKSCRTQAKKSKPKKTYVRKRPPITSANKTFVGNVDVTSTEFLSTYEWRRLRMEALKKYGPKCMCCGATPATGAVMNVDHIKPRKLFPALALDINNLQILCHDCNHGKGNWDQTDWR